MDLVVSVLIIAFICVLAGIYLEARRVDAFSKAIAKDIHKQDGKWTDVLASWANFNASWPWEWNFENMIVRNK